MGSLKQGNAYGLGKTVFTTGQAAKLCGMSQQSVIRSFDEGRLKGFRIPGSKFRRIPREQLLEFMETYGIPTDALLGANGEMDETQDSAAAAEGGYSESNGQGRSNSALEKRVATLETQVLNLAQWRTEMGKLFGPVGQNGSGTE